MAKYTHLAVKKHDELVVRGMNPKVSYNGRIDRAIAVVDGEKQRLLEIE